jgi:hypothetical protein
MNGFLPARSIRQDAADTRATQDVHLACLERGLFAFRPRLDALAQLEDRSLSYIQMRRKIQLIRNHLALTASYQIQMSNRRDHYCQKYNRRNPSDNC